MSRANELQHSLIFIPDISGFTAFINKVEIEHSTHIISELLEIIIEANEIGLKVSEIEGDAVLFYRPGKAPRLEELARQAESMFLKFHEHLKLYKQNRICQCAACSTSHNLSLKFIAHYGEVTVRNIKDYEKLFGPDVTLAHRLLKNNVDSDEYLLFTTPANISELDIPEWIQIKQGKNQYQEIGEIEYSYLLLTPLIALARAPGQQRLVKPPLNPISTSVILNAPLKTVHAILTNASLKTKWSIGTKAIKEENDKLSTIGSRHLCITSNGNVDFEIFAQDIKNGKIEYVEKTESFKSLSPVFIHSVMERISDCQTKVVIRIDYKRNWLTKTLLFFPVRLMVWLMIRLSMNKLKTYISQLPSDRCPPDKEMKFVGVPS